MKEGDIELPKHPESLATSLMRVYDAASMLASSQQIPHREAFERVCELLDMGAKAIEPMLMLRLMEEAAVCVKEIMVGTGNMILYRMYGAYWKKPKNKLKKGMNHERD
jgi:hypothetical protein